MPQLFSRMDDANWLTPSIADILDQGAAPPGGDGTMRETIIQLQDEFSALETPVKIANVRPTPSYTMFVMQPEMIGRLGSRRTISVPELRRSAGQMAEKHKEWRIGFLSQLEDTPDAVGLFLRTDKNRPLSLRRLLVQGAFRNHPSSLAFTLGNTLEQRLIVRDLEDTQHLLIVGESSARQHFISSMLLTLTLLNTPAEVRILLAGRGSEQYQELVDLPHAMTTRIVELEELISTLTNLMTEAQTRLDSFYEEGVNLLKSYNARLREEGKPNLPHIVVALDPLTDEAFTSGMERLAPLVRDLLVNGSQVGIHVVLAVNQMSEFPPILDGLIQTQITMRSATPDLGDKVKNWHSSLLRFVDAFIVEKSGAEITPVELCAVSPGEIHDSVAYWQAVVAQRKQEIAPDTQGTRTSGTGLLTLPQPQPQTASVSAPSPAASPQAPQAAMLAAYLGWLSVGALRDIFALSDEDAQAVLQQLKSSGVIEDGDSAMLRFVRLAERPS